MVAEGPSSSEDLTTGKNHPNLPTQRMPSFDMGVREAQSEHPAQATKYSLQDGEGRNWPRLGVHREERRVSLVAR